MKAPAAPLRQNDPSNRQNVADNPENTATSETFVGLYLQGSDETGPCRSIRQERTMNRPGPGRNSDTPTATPVFSSPWIALFAQLRASMQPGSPSRY